MPFGFLALLAAFGTLANSLRSNSASVLIRTLLRCSARPNGGGYLSARPLREPRQRGLFASLTSRGLGCLISLPSLLTRARHAVPLRPPSSPLTPHPSPLTPHPSPLTPHPSPLTPHSSLLTPHSSLLPPPPPSSLLPPPSSLLIKKVSTKIPPSPSHQRLVFPEQKRFFGPPSCCTRNIST